MAKKKKTEKMVKKRKTEKMENLERTICQMICLKI